MNFLLTHLLRASLTGGALIGAVCLLRGCRKQVGSRAVYAAWLLVALRLLLPLSVPVRDMPVRPVSRVEAVFEDYVEEAEAPRFDFSAQGAEEKTAAPVVRAEEVPQAEQAAPAEAPAASPAPARRAMDPAAWLTALWALGAAVTAAGMTARSHAFFRRLKLRPLSRENRARVERICLQNGWKPLAMRQSAALDSPCLCGVLRPKLLLPAELPGDEALYYMLLHERCHARTGDTLWAFVRGALCCAFWFHPLVWLAARLNRADAELACDERVAARLSAVQRCDYAETLLGLAARQNGFAAPAGVHFGGAKLKARILSILHFSRGKRVWLCAACVLLAAAFCMSMATAKEEPVTFADATVEQIIREALEIPEGQPVTTEDMKRLKEFSYLQQEGMPTIQTLEDLALCENLEEFGLSSTLRSGGYLLGTGRVYDVSVLGELKNLQRVGLGVRAKGMQSILSLPNLKEFASNAQVGGSQLDLSPLNNSSSLERFWYWGPSSRESKMDYTPLKNHPHLRQVRLVYQGADELIDLLRAWPELGLLQVQDCDMTNVALASMATRSLKVLDLINCENLDDYSPLAAQKDLYHLAVVNCNVGNEQLKQIVNVAPNLSYLSITDNPVTDLSPVARLKNLTNRFSVSCIDGLSYTEVKAFAPNVENFSYYARQGSKVESVTKEKYDREAAIAANPQGVQTYTVEAVYLTPEEWAQAGRALENPERTIGIRLPDWAGERALPLLLPEEMGDPQAYNGRTLLVTVETPGELSEFIWNNKRLPMQGGAIAAKEVRNGEE